ATPPRRDSAASRMGEGSIALCGPHMGQKRVDGLRGGWFYAGVVRTGGTNYSEAKLQQVILYFLERINNVHLGRTKLMKLLYFVDFDHYEKYGEPVTGAVYRKFPHGPYPKKVEKLIPAMERADLVREVKTKRGAFTQHRLI